MYSKKEKIVLVFGVFDDLHLGHQYFLRASARHGEKLVIAVARDEVVLRLKCRKPQHDEESRATELRRMFENALVILGDAGLGSYEVIKKYSPAVICVGYDQSELLRDLEEKMTQRKIPRIPLVTISSFERDKFHTSLLRGNTVRSHNPE